MNTLKTTLFTALLSTSLLAAEPLYTCEGTDPSFATVLENGGIKPGERPQDQLPLGHVCWLEKRRIHQERRPAIRNGCHNPVMKTAATGKITASKHRE